MTFDSFKRDILVYLEASRDWEKQDIQDHENLPETDKIEQGYMIKNAIITKIDKQGACELSTPNNYTKWKIGDTVNFAWLPDGIERVTGSTYITDNLVDSISVSKLLKCSKIGEFFNFYKQENELYSIYISIINEIQDGASGAGYLKVLANIKEPKIEGFSKLSLSSDDIPKHLNKEQLKAVEAIIKCPQLYAIQGPPGTGKTDVLSVIAKLYSEQGKEVLIVSNTHQAVNNALNKIAKYDLPIYKLGSELKSQGLDSKIKIMPDNVEYRKERKRTKGKKQGDIVGMTLCGALLNLAIHGSAFTPSIILVDEASQIPLAQAAAIGGLGAGSCVFIGDDRQMPPIFHEKMEKDPLSISIFEYLQKLLPTELKTTLTTTYRMNEPICSLVSELFYEPYGIKLNSHESIKTRCISGEDLQNAVEYYTIDTNDCMDSNLKEANLAVQIAQKYQTANLEVAIVTPFRKQVNLVREQWKANGGVSSDILVDTVERLQGQDVDVIILTTSVSDSEYFKETVSFVQNPNRLNVMLSRAKKKVVIIKSPLITINRKNGSITNLQEEPDDAKSFAIDGEPEEASKARQLILSQFGDLEFVEEGHKYFLHGKELPSVSGIGHRFIKDPFDEQIQATNYALKHGQTAEYWIKQWRCNSFRATTLGTKTHEFGESLGYLLAGHPELIRDSVRAQYLDNYHYLAPIHPKEEAVVSFMNELPRSYHLVLNETRVYSGKNPDMSLNLKEQICGTFDMLYWYDGDGDPSKAGFIVLDYKTNAKLYSEYNQTHNKMLLPPFSNFVEEDHSLYVIQLNLYALMLEDIGLPVIARKIVWLRDDGTYKMIDTPDISDILRKVL